MIDINTPDSHSLYSLVGLDSYGIDCEMYFESMKKFPVLISIDLGESIKALGEFTTNGCAELSKLIESFLLVINTNDDLEILIEEVCAAPLVRVLITAKWNVDNISDKDYEDINDLLRKKYSKIAHNTIGKIINAFCYHEIPYFEHYLPYKFLGINADTGYAIFSQMSFDNLFQHISRKQL